MAASERETLRRLLETEPVRQRIVTGASEQRELLLRYFAQEGLFDGPRYGIIDLGWYGSMQRALAAILREAGYPAPPGFYFALHRGEIVDEAPLHREAYYFDERTTTGYVNAVPNLIALMEMFCTADHGTALGFEKRDGRIEPVLANAVNEAAGAWGLPVLKKTVKAFVDNLFLDRAYLDPNADVRDAATAVLSEFSRHPAQAEAAVWGEFPWEDGLGADTVRNSFAAPFHPRDLVLAVRAGSIRPHHRASWIEGSLALSPAPLRAALESAAEFGRRRRRFAGFIRRGLKMRPSRALN